jgi:hypothetical protein
MNSKKGIVKFLDVVIYSAMLCIVTVTFLVGCHHEVESPLSDATNKPAYLSYSKMGKPLVLQPKKTANSTIVNQQPM